MSNALKDRFTKITVEEISTPKDGHRTLLDRWWVTDDEQTVFVKRYAYAMLADDPICNRDEGIARSLAQTLGFSGVVFVPIAYIQL